MSDETLGKWGIRWGGAMGGHLCSRLGCHLGGKVQEITQERKDGQRCKAEQK